MAAHRIHGSRKERSRIRSKDEEREYLEGLLNTRFNFYLVAVSVFVFAVFRDSLSELERAIALFIGGIVSLTISLAVRRTCLLVETSLENLREDQSHPYTRLYRKISKSSKSYAIWDLPLKISANQYIGWTTTLVTILLFAASGLFIVHLL
jgi:hypothetical protein